MGNFFTSPREQASRSLYDAATGGRPIGEGYFRSAADAERQKLQAETSQRTAGMGGDILSRLASMGVSPGASSEALTSKALSPVVQGEQQGEVGIGADLQRTLGNLLLHELDTGLSGLSSSSTFGNILAGLQTAGNIATGGVNLWNALKTGNQSIGGFSGDNYGTGKRVEGSTPGSANG